MERINSKTDSQLKYKLIALDVDNTLLDWVGYYAPAFMAMLGFVSRKIGTKVDTLCEEAKVVFEQERSVEYPFLVQELPSVIQFFGSDIEQMIEGLVTPARQIFLEEASSKLKLYPTVMDSLHILKEKYPDLPIVALSDAPRYVAMWKLNKVGILSSFDAIYGLADPRVPVCKETQKVKVDQSILIKHLSQENFDFKGQIRTLPDSYEKPGVRGFKTVLMDYDIDFDFAGEQVLWVGDNLAKDVKLGAELGITTAWAKYGTVIDAKAEEQLGQFSPKLQVKKNISEVRAANEIQDFSKFHEIDSFSEILNIIHPQG